MRAGFDPIKHYSPRDNIMYNLIGRNSGNMMFAYSVMNALTTNNAVCVPTYYQNSWSDQEIDYINQTYDALILPLADGFRDDFVPALRALTQLMKKLIIPCIVIGVGLRADFEPKLNIPRSFDKTTKEFVSEVLNHSACLGLRGEITAQYLKN